MGWLGWPDSRVRHLDHGTTGVVTRRAQSDGRERAPRTTAGASSEVSARIAACPVPRPPPPRHRWSAVPTSSPRPRCSPTSSGTRPLWHSRALADRVGGPVWLKCENLQRTGSFKIRGAYTRIARLTDDERARGVVAASAGNHAQGVALAARLLGCSATVFMPETAPLPKVAATRAYGAEVRLGGPTLTEALVAASEHAGADRRRCSSTPSTTPTSSPGRARSAWRSSSSARTSPPSSSAPAAAGCVVRHRRGGEGPPARRPGRRRAGRDGGGVPRLAGRGPARWRWPAMATMADGIAVASPGRPHPRPRRRAWSTRCARSPRRTCPARCCSAWSGPSSWSSRPAWPRSRRCSAEPRAFAPPVVAVVSGGNIDPVLLLKVVQHGMAAAGRYLSLRLRVPDRPGSLAAPAGRAGRGRRQRARGRARAHRPAAATSARSRSSSSWRRAAPTTPRRSPAALSRAGYPVEHD